MDDLRAAIELFVPLNDIDIDGLAGQDLSPVLPSLVKLLTCPSFVDRPKLLRLLYNNRKTNDVIQLMKPQTIETFDSTILTLPEKSFEAADHSERLRIVTHEYLKLHEQVHKSPNGPPTKFIKSALFDNSIYLHHISYCLYVIASKSGIIPELNIRDISDKLLYVREGSKFILALVVNMPDKCREVSSYLLNNGERLDEATAVNDISDQRAKILRLLCAMNPYNGLTIRSTTLQLCKMPSLTIMITIDHLQEAIDKHESELKIPNGNGDSTMDIDHVISDPKTVATLDNVFDSTIAFVTGIFVGGDEATRVWFSQYTKSAQQKRIDQGSYSILTKFRSQIVYCMNRLLHELVANHHQDSSPENSNGHVNDVSSTPGPPKPKDLKKKIIRATACLRLYCALRGMGSIKLNPEEVDVLINLITCKLSADQTSLNFAATGICTLLACSALISNCRDERKALDWLKWMVKDSGYGDNNLLVDGKSTIFELSSSIANHFQDNQTNMIAELVCSTLDMNLQIKASVSKCKALFINDIFSDHLLSNSTNKTNLTKRNHTLDCKTLSRYQEPIKDWIYQHWILNTAFCSLGHWMTIEHYDPHLLMGSEYDQDPRDESVRLTEPHDIPPTVKTLIDQMISEFKDIEANPQALSKTIGFLLNLADVDLRYVIDAFMTNWCKLLDVDCQGKSEKRQLVKQVTKLWWRINTISPRKVWLLTINTLRRSSLIRDASFVKPIEHTWDEVVEDPLVVLRCDTRVFRRVELLNIILHVLSAFLAAFRRCVHDQIIDHPERNKQEQARNIDELRTALVLAQTSAAIQILLESCLPSDTEQEALNKRESNKLLSANERSLLENYDSGVSCICEHMHQIFIADTNLAKLVHFQTYPSELLSITTDKIPSMHICLDYIAELLSQPDLMKQVFVTELTSHLCVKYAITKSLNAAKLCFNVAYTLLQVLPNERRALFFVPVLPALLRICKVFSILKEDTEVILTQIDQITSAHLASTTSRFCLNSSRPFDGLENINWRDMKARVKTLGPHEALYLCIKKCFCELNKLNT